MKKHRIKFEHKGRMLKCKENFDDKDYFPCEHCKNYVNVGLTENYCDAIRCIEYDDD